MAKGKKSGGAAAPVSGPAPIDSAKDDGLKTLAETEPAKAPEPAPESKPEKPAKEPADSAEKPPQRSMKPAPQSLDSLMDKVGTDMKKGGPAPKAEEPKTEPQPAQEGYDDDEEQQTGDQAEPPEPEPKAAEPTPVAREDHPLTPEEVNLLRRSRATEEEIEGYASIPVAQRNLLLAPLRKQQANLDRLFGLPKEQRDAALERERQGNTEPEAKEDRATAEIRQKLVPDVAQLEKFAKANGLDLDSVKELAGTLMQAPAAVIAELERRDQSRARETQIASLRAAGDKTRAQLTKTFPKLGDDAEFAKLVQSPDFNGLYRVHIDSGLGVAEAVERAMRSAAVLRYQAEIQQRNRQYAEGATRQARATAEPTSKPRGQPEAPKRPKNVDEAMEMSASSLRGEG